MAYQVEGRSSYSAPVGGPMGRTDEGVDWDTTPGETVRSIGKAIVTFVGRYSGFGPYVAYRLQEGPHAGEEIYSAEHGTTLVHVGQHVRRGQAIGRAADSIEVGFAQEGPTYLPLAQVEPGGYSEGEVTAAGRRFRAMMQGADTGGENSTLSQLWIDAGGRPALANIMAAIALAESGGVVDKVGGPNQDGTYDYGLWQINSSHHYNRRRLLNNPRYNAHAAVDVERTQGLSAWATYTNGAYRSHLGEAGPSISSGPPRSRPGGGNRDPEAADNANQEASWKSYVNPLIGPFSPPGAWDALEEIFKHSPVHGLGSFLHWTAWIFHPRNLLRIVEFLTGAGLFALGLATSVKVFADAGSGAAGALGKAAAATPAGRAVELRKAARGGRQAARFEARSEARSAARKRGRKQEKTRLAEKQSRKEGRNTGKDEIPF